MTAIMLPPLINKQTNNNNNKKSNEIVEYCENIIYYAFNKREKR